MLHLERDELKELGKSTLIVALVFTIAFGRKSTDISIIPLALIFVLSGVCAGAGFIFHELMHKFTAQRYGFQARYHGSDMTPFLSIIAAFAGYILLAPGAVYISSAHRHITKRENGIISLAGPATNFILALGFLGAYLTNLPALGLVGYFGYDINIWLALFNMIPALGFDGQKIWAWNKTVFITFTLILAAFFLVF
jgi:Zn-dependent protease